MRKTRSLKRKILVSSLIVIAIFALITGFIDYFVLKFQIIDRAQRQVRSDLKTAHLVLKGQLEMIQKGFVLVNVGDNMLELKEKTGLDYLLLVQDTSRTRSDIVRKAAAMHSGTGGFRIIGNDELQGMGRDICEKAAVVIRGLPDQPDASEVKKLEGAMALEYAKPLYDEHGEYKGILVGGRIINNNLKLVDTIHQFVFEEEAEDSRPIGTVTIFQGDVRVATNVVDTRGEKAIGTRLSPNVREEVLQKGKEWVDRAFVVSDWYLTAYEPIRDTGDKVIGVLYVGILEKPFRDVENRMTLYSIIALAAAIVLSVILSFYVAETIAKPTASVLEATEKISNGDLNYRLDADMKIRELNSLAEAFNAMAETLSEREKSLLVSNEKLAEREKSLVVSNEKLTALNKNYLDLISFVTHELKGILASTLLNAYTVRDGFLGMINFKQRKALDAVARNLDYFDATVKNFLNLSRLEKGEISVTKRELALKEDIFGHAVEDIQKPASEKNIEIENAIDPGIKVKGDYNLLQIVANNLVGNAVKYGSANGSIRLSSSMTGDKVEIDVFNEGRPVTEQEKEKLFKKFSRLDAQETRRAKGTGLGLYITKEIIEKHGGSIRIEPREKGNSFIIQLERGT